MFRSQEALEHSNNITVKRTIANDFEDASKEGAFILDSVIDRAITDFLENRKTNDHFIRPSVIGLCLTRHNQSK